MVVIAAPMSVPATPKREVTRAAVAEARPAAATELPVTTGCELWGDKMIVH